jgi:hypothetical protein
VKLAWLAGAAATAVIAAAAVDALRREDEPQPARTETSNEIKGRTEVVEALRALGVRGELALHDGACGEATLTLPGLERRTSPLPCAPTGVRSPLSDLVARCVDGRIEVSSETTGALEWFDRGCVPAWLPNGGLTATYAGEVVRLRPCDAFPCVAIPLHELERAARLHPTVPDRIGRLRPLVDGIAWLSNERAAVALSIRLGGRFDRLGPLSAIAFFEDGRLADTQPYYRATGGMLAASPRGTYVTRTPDVILRGDGSHVSLPQHLRDVRDFAWSPDERFVALATRFAVVVVDVLSLERYDQTGGGLRTVTLPRQAARLSWR